MKLCETKPRTTFAHAVLIDPLKDARWDEFVINHPFGWLTHLSAWKRVLESSFRHMRGHYLALLDDTGHAIRAALPIYAVDSWLTGRRLVSIPFATLCDPLISGQDDMEGLHDGFRALTKSVRASYVEIRTHMSSTLMANDVYGVRRIYKHHYIPLNPDPDQVRKTFHRSCVRQRIARAEKSGLRLKVGDSEADVRVFYELYKKTRQLLHLPPHPYAFITSIWNSFAPLHQVRLMLAYHNDRPIAGMLLFRFKDRVSAEFSAMDESYKNLSPIHFLFWESIKAACREGFTIFDFGRTSRANESLINFKSRWGTQSVDLAHYYFPKRVPERLDLVEDSIRRKLVKGVCRIAPECAFESIGKFCYRHMG